MNSIVFREKARNDLRSISIHYLLYATEADRNRHIQNILDGLQLIAEMPDIGRAIEDVSGFIGPGFRRFLKDGFWIVYSFAQETVTIWTIYHAKQNIDEYDILDLNTLQ